MTFAAQPLKLPGSTVNHSPLRECSRCGHDKETGGGIDLGPGRWCCASCWTAKTNPGKTGHFKKKESHDRPHLLQR